MACDNVTLIFMKRSKFLRLSLDFHTPEKFSVFRRVWLFTPWKQRHIVTCSQKLT